MVGLGVRMSAASYQRGRCGSCAMLATCDLYIQIFVVPFAATKRLYASLRGERAGTRSHSRWWRRVDRIVPHRVPLFKVLLVVPVVLARALAAACDLVLALSDDV
jgi:hypothetical protein